MQGDLLLLQAYRARGQLLDILTITIAYPAEPGRYGPEIPSDFAYGVPSPGQPGYAFRLVSGDVVIAGLEGQRIRGEFTAVGENVDFLADPQVRNLQVANGSFDVPILERR